MNTFLPAFALALAGLLSTSTAQAAHSTPAPMPAWLDATDLDVLEQGRGAGMARAAEAHGLPGPRHVLEHADALGLDAQQRAQMESLMAAMHTAAREAGKAVLDAERALDAELARDRPHVDRVSALAEAAGLARGRLRHVHLRTHLAAAPLLTPAQRLKYQQLRRASGA
jgi:Spy/CpxP family protein refolding chaperone